MVGPPDCLFRAINCRSPRIAERVGSRLTRIWAGLYTRPRMGTDTIQPSHRLPTTDYRLPTTDYRLPTTDYRLPTTDYRLPTSRPDLAAPVLSAAPSIRVAPSRHAAVRPTAEFVGRHASARRTADQVGRRFHQSIPTCVATLPAVRNRWVTCPTATPRGVLRHAHVKGGKG